MTRDEPRRCDKSRPLCVHAQRDAEEQDRLRQLGGILVHDLNNALFAVIGRTQLLARKLQGAPEGQSVKELYETVRLLESLVGKLQSACQREQAQDERSNLRAAVLVGLGSALGTLPQAIRPGGDVGFDAWLENFVHRIPRDLFVDGSITQVAGAIAQLIAIHRPRATQPISVCCDIRERDGHIHFDLHAEDDGGHWEHGVEPPSLLHGTFDLALLPLAAARRATRDFGGVAVLERAPSGLRSHLSFKVTRGLPLAQHDPSGHTAYDADHAPRKRRVLVADDDATVRALLVAALESVDDDVETTDNPAALLQVPDLESFDVVVLDAGGGGLESLARLRASGSDLPVLVASGDMIDGNFDESTRIVMKPIPLERLDRELTQLASRRRR